MYSAHMKTAPGVLNWVIGEAVPLGRLDTYYIRSYYKDMESKQLYLIHRNKHREAGKRSRKRNMAQMKE